MILLTAVLIFSLIVVIMGIVMDEPTVIIVGGAMIIMSIMEFRSAII